MEELVKYIVTNLVDNEEEVKIEHVWDEGVKSETVNGVYTTTYTCECTQTKVITTDTKVYTHDNWTQVGDPKSYYFDNNKIYSFTHVTNTV